MRFLAARLHALRCLDAEQLEALAKGAGNEIAQAQPARALFDRNVDAHGTRKVAAAYLNYLSTPEAQEIIARNYYRPRDPAVAARHAGKFAKLPLFTIDRNVGGWAKVQAIHFNNGGLVDPVVEDAKR